LRDVGPAFLEGIVGEDEVAGEGVPDARGARREEVPVPRIGDAENELPVVVTAEEAGLAEDRGRRAAGDEGRPVPGDERGLSLEGVARVGEIAVDLEAAHRRGGRGRVL